MLKRSYALLENKLNILVTGSAGFIGKNLVERLHNLGYSQLMLFDINTPKELLSEYAQKADIVFHLAGVNRPVNPAEFYEGNSGLTDHLLSLLTCNDKNPTLVITSSVQAAMDNDYGKSKKLAEDAVRDYGKNTGARVHIFRLPGVFGKWCRPAYNSVVATFCYNVANGLPVEVRDASYKFPLVYIDDVVDCLLNTIAQNTMGEECRVLPEYTITLGDLANNLNSFKQSRSSLVVPNMSDELCKKLYSTYLSYLPKNEFSYPLTMNCDDRGSFTEFIRTQNAGQVSINVSRPGIVRGNHWHDTKNEKFLVVSGTGVIRFRKINSDEIIEYFVSGEKHEVVDIPTGYTHNIENLGQSDMVTVMWANEPFNKDKPDTYFVKV